MKAGRPLARAHEWYRAPGTQRLVPFLLTACLAIGAGLIVAGRDSYPIMGSVGFGFLVVLLGSAVFFRPEWGLVLLLWITYFNDAVGHYVFDSKVFSVGKLWGVLVLLGWLASQARQGRLRIHLGRSGWFSLCLLLWMVLSSWANQDLEVEAFLLVMSGIALYILIVNLIKTKETLRLFVINLVLIAILASIFLFMSLSESAEYASPSEVRSATRAQETGIIGNLNDLALFLNIALPFVLVGVAMRGRHRVLMQVMAVMLLIAVAVTASRGGIVAMVIMVSLLAIRFKQVRYLALVALGLGVILAPFISNIAYLTTRFTLADAPSFISSYGRLNAFRIGMAMGTANPWWGVGPLNWSKSILEYGDSILGLIPESPHNTFLQAFSELGIPGLLILAALLGSAMAGLIGLSREGMRCGITDPWTWVLWALVVGYLVSISTVNHLYSRDLFLVLGLVEAYRTLRPSGTQLQSARGGERG